MSERITVKEAARTLGVSEQCVREGMKRKILDLGVVIPTSGTKLNYLIYRKKLDALVGRSTDETNDGSSLACSNVSN